MEDCCRHLATASEYPTDKLIEPLVLLASLAGRVGETFSYFDVEYNSVRGNSGVSMTADGFLHELQLIETSAVAEKAHTGLWMKHTCYRLFTNIIIGNGIINMELDYTESYILEVAVHNELWEAAPNRAPGIGTSRIRIQSLFTPSRSAMLWHMLNSNKAFVQKFLEIHDSIFQCLPYTVFWRMCYVLASLIRLTFTLVESMIVSDRTAATTHILSVPEVSDESRSRQAAEQIADEINLSRIIGNLVTKFESAAQAQCLGAIRTNDNLAPFITKLQNLAITYPRKLRDAIAGVGTVAVETDLMLDCQAHTHIQGGHRGPTEQPNRDAPGDGTQMERFEGADDGGEGNIQTHEWPLLNNLTGLESVDMEWESIMRAFTIPP